MLLQVSKLKYPIVLGKSYGAWIYSNSVTLWSTEVYNLDTIMMTIILTILLHLRVVEQTQAITVKLF